MQPNEILARHRFLPPNFFTFIACETIENVTSLSKKKEQWKRLNRLALFIIHFVSILLWIFLVDNILFRFHMTKVKACKEEVKFVLYSKKTYMYRKYPAFCKLKSHKR